MSLKKGRSEKLNEEADALIEAHRQTAVVEPEVVDQEPVPDEQPTGDPTPIPEKDDTGVDPQPDNSAEEVARVREQLAASEQRYRTLQGMFEKLREDNKELRELVKQLGEQKPADAKAPEVAAKYVTDKDTEAFGADLIDLARRAAQEVIESKLGTIDGKFDEVNKSVQKVGEVAKLNALDKFHEKLSEAVPDWDTINNDPAFSEWLGQYGLQAIGHAYAAMDVAGTAKFFRDYKVLTGKNEPEVSAPAPSAKLETLQAPGKSKTVTAPPASKGKIWTRADINKLSDDYAKGRITEDTYKQLEADLFKAQGEGRIT